MTDKLTALLDEIETLEKAATPAPWGPYDCNLPFYVVVTKTAASMSKHDDKRPNYWRIEDAKLLLALRNHATLLTSALRECLGALEKYESVPMASAQSGDFCTADLNFIARETLARVRGRVEK